MSDSGHLDVYQMHTACLTGHWIFASLRLPAGSFGNVANVAATSQDLRIHIRLP